MCGICGQLNWGGPSEVNTAVLKNMNDVIRRRGPDDEGFYSQVFRSDSPAETGSVGLAMRRLSIIDLSTGKQPIFNETGDIVVVYNGETYNFQELRSELVALGHTFKTKTDTEVLVHGYESWGDEVASKMNGMFGFALWDSKKLRMVLARDRMGIKPLYYSLTGGKLVFGSEIKSILQDPGVSREIDSGALDDYFTMRCVPTPLSIYRSIKKLEPGMLLIWEKGVVSFKDFWKFSPQETEDQGLSFYLEKLDGLLDDAVRSQLVSDVPLGTFLSGGLDSPAISYYAKKHKPDLMTFNIYFSDKSFSEREEATSVAHFLGTRHLEKEVTPNIIQIIPDLVDAFDEPFGDDSMIPTYFLTKMAREKMTVALSGDGGDELFGGYPTYVADRLAKIYRAIPGAIRNWLFEPVVFHLPVSFERISFDYRARAFVTSAKRPSPLEHLGWTEVFSPEMKQKLYSPSFWEEVKARPTGSNFQKAYAESGSRKGLEKFLYVDQKTHLLDEFLVKMDRASMWHSLEVRPPFLDHRLVEFAAEIPMRYKIQGFTTKILIRRLMKGRIPEKIVRGEKKGFSPPMARWIASDLLEYIRQKFSPDRIREIPFLNPTFPLELLEQHVKRQTNLGRRLWGLLMFVEWYDRKIRGQVCSIQYSKSV